MRLTSVRKQQQTLSSAGLLDMSIMKFEILELFRIRLVVRHNGQCVKHAVDPYFAAHCLV